MSKGETVSERKSGRRGETEFMDCFVLFPEGSITLVQAYITLGDKPKKIVDASLASQAPTSMEYHWYGDKLL